MKSTRLLILSFVLIVAACSQRGFYTNLDIESRPTPGVDFSDYQTWRFGRADEYPTTGDATLDDPRFRDSVGKHTIAEMEKLGYSYVDKDPNFVMMFHIAVEQKFDEQKMADIYQGYDMAWAQMSSSDYWKEGSLFLFAMDAATGEQIWSSVAQAKLDERSSYDTKRQRFNKVVSMMLEDFPSHAK